MNWTASDVIAGVAIVASATVAIVTVRLQHRAAATSRRREAHLRAWQAANQALRAQQAWFASMEQPRVDLDRSESEEITTSMQAFRDAHVELEILSPRLAKECGPALAALELSRGDLRELAGIRREMSAGGPSGGAFGHARDAARGDLDSARVTLNRVQKVMSRYERSGMLPWWAGRRTRHRE